MVRDLGIVKDAFVRPDPPALKNLAGEGGVAGSRQHPERRLDRIEVIFRQGARVGARVGQHLVPLVEGLGQ